MLSMFKVQGPVPSPARKNPKGQSAKVTCEQEGPRYAKSSEAASVNPQGRGNVPEPGVALRSREDTGWRVGSGLESCEQGQEAVGGSVQVLRGGESPAGFAAVKEMDVIALKVTESV